MLESISPIILRLYRTKRLYTYFGFRILSHDVFENVHTEQIAMKPRHSFLLLVVSILVILTVIFLLITTKGEHPFRYNYEFFDATNSAATDAVMADRTGELSLNTSSSDSAAKMILTDPGSLRACIAAADVCGTRDGYFRNMLSVGEDMNVTGRFGVGGNTHMNSDIDILGTLAVNGMSTINKVTNITGGLGVRNSLSTKENATVMGNMTVDQDVGIGNSLSVTNNGTIRGQTHVAGNANISGPANVRNVVNVANDLSVAGATNVTGLLDTKSQMSVSGNMNVGGNASVSGSALMRSDAQVNGALAVQGPLTVGKNGLRVYGETHFNGDTSIARALRVYGLTKVSGGVNIQSKHGEEMTSIGERQDGQNVIYGTTTVLGNKFCLNGECLTSAELQTIKNNETELSAMLAVWDKEIVGNINTAKNNLSTYVTNITAHNESEKTAYDSLLKAYETREHSINDLAVKIPAFKESLANNWLYEIKQDDRIRQIGRNVITVAGPYYGAVESTLKPNECPAPTTPPCNEKDVPWNATFWQEDNYGGSKLDVNENSPNVIKESENAWVFPTPFGVSSWQVSDYARLYFTNDKNKSSWWRQPNNKQAAGDVDLRYIKIEKIKPLCPDKIPPWRAVFYKDDNRRGSWIEVTETTGDKTSDGDDAWVLRTPFGVSSWEASDYVKLFFTDDEHGEAWVQQPNVMEAAGDIDLRYIRIQKLKPVVG